MYLLRNCIKVRKREIVSLVFGLLLGIETLAQAITERPQGTTQAPWGYLEYLSSEYTSNQEAAFPLLVSLHGIGEAGNGTSELNRVLKHGPIKLIKENQWPADRPFIVIAPQSPGGFFNPTKLHNFIEYLKDSYRVDENRIYLTGLSAGGISIWNYLAEYQDQITAAVPIAGKGQIIRNEGLCQLAKLPIWAFHGSNDGTVKPNGSIIPIEFLRNCPDGSSSISKLTIYTGAGHDSWSRTYNLSGMSGSTDSQYDSYDISIYDWLLSHRKGESATNQPPTISVEPDKTITLPESTLTITGNGSDPEGDVLYQWNQQEGPSPAVLEGAISEELTVSSLEEGDYTFRFTVTDEANISVYEDVNVAVIPAPVSPTPSPSPSPLPNTGCDCDHVITPNKTYVNGDHLNVQPGDVICLQAGEYKYLNLYNFHGTAEQPLTFTNCGGQVKIGNYQWHYGFVMNNNRHFRLTGTGDDTYEYGIKIDGIKDNASGFAIATYSSDFEIDHLEISNTGFAGMHIVMKPTCDPASQKGNYVMRNINIHDNYVHDTHGEGLYIGHSKYTGASLTCDGQQQTVYPHTIEGIRVRDNIIEHTGWDGFQVSCAVKDCEIYGNIVKDYGRANKSSQRAGIVIGGGSTGRLYNNYIYQGTGGGIHVFGIGDNLIYNNVIVEAGEDGIFISDKTTEVGRSFSVVNNTIISPKRDGIRMYSQKSSNNQFVNNIIANPGSYNDYSNPSKAFVYLNSNLIDCTITNNIFETDVEGLSFVDPANQDFHLKPTSPAIDMGMDVLSFNIVKDHDNLARLVGTGVDAGACEYQESVANTPPTDQPGQEQGLAYAYYEGSWDSIPDFAALQAVETGQVATFDLSPSNRNDLFAFNFEGFISIETAGDYTFYTASDDGSLLFIDGQPVVDNDGLHGLREEQGSVYLAAGKHPIQVAFFEKAGNQILKVQYAGPGIDKQVIPAEVLSYDEADVIVTDPPTDQPGQEQGLAYAYYEGSWDSIPDFAALQAVKTGQVATFDLSPSNRNDLFAFNFEGFISIETAGDYTFYTASDDGSLLFIDGQPVVDNDGLHGLREEQGSVYLAAGKHPIQVAFFEKAGNQILKVQYAGPGIDKQVIPAEVLFLTGNSSPVVPSPLAPSPPTSSTKIMVNFNYDQNAPAPWNNTSADPRFSKQFLNLNDEQGSQTEVSLTITTPWGKGYAGSYNDKGEATGNDSGSYPDAVMKTSYWIGTSNVETLKISGLAANAPYQFTLFASRKGTGNRTTLYSIGEETVSLNASANTSEAVAITAESDASGVIYIDIQKAQDAQYGYINALIIESVSATEARETRSLGKQEAIQPQYEIDHIEAALGNAQVYPNPIVDLVHVKLALPNGGPIRLLVKDLSGNTVARNSYKSNLGDEYTLSLSHLKSGIYVVQIAYRSYLKQFKLIKN